MASDPNHRLATITKKLWIPCLASLVIVGCQDRTASPDSQASGASAASSGEVSASASAAEASPQKSPPPFAMRPDAAASREALSKQVQEAEGQVARNPGDVDALLRRGRAKLRLSWFVSPQEKLHLTAAAQADFEQAAQLGAKSQPSPMPFVELAQLFMGQYRYAEAMQQANQARAIDADSPAVRALHTRLAAIASGDWLTCVESIRALKSHSQKSESISYDAMLGQALQFAGRSEEAEQSYRTALQSDPHDWKSWNNLAIVLQNAGRLEEAGAIQERLMTGGQGDLLGANNLAVTLISDGKNEEALKILTEVLSLAPGFPAAWLNKGNALGALKRYDEAIASYDRAIALLPSYTDAHCNKALALREAGRYVEAIALYRRLLQGNPEDVRALTQLGETLWRAKRFPEAIDSYKQLLKLRPDDPFAHNDLGGMYVDLKEWDTAEPLLREAARLKPELPPVWYNLGLVAQGRGRAEEAIELLKRAVVLDPRYSPALSKLRDILLEAGRNDEAIAEIKAVIRAAPDHALSHLALSNAYYSIGSLRDSVDAISQAIKLKPEANLIAQRGVVLLELEQPHEALMDLQNAYSAAPDNVYPLLFMWAHQDAFEQGVDIGASLDAAALKPLSDEWQARLLEFCRGKARAEQLLAEAASSEQRCEALYYVGEQKRLAGDAAAAAPYFSDCMELGLTQFFEYRLARYRLRRAERDAETARP